MNDRHRQVEKARRMLAPKQGLLDRFLSGIDWDALNDSFAKLSRALVDLARAATAALPLMCRDLTGYMDREREAITAALLADPENDSGEVSV